MNLKTGEIIKRLRIENNITQDQLATAIGVTPQAISRWESSTCYPDIELLPGLADFFAVSIDELLGYRLSEREENISSIKKEIERLEEFGNTEECINYAREAVSRYPSDPELRENLAACLAGTMWGNPDPALLKESENIYLSLLDDNISDEQRYNILEGLTILYANGLKEPDKAFETSERLTPLKYCREIVRSYGIGDGNTEFYIQKAIDNLTDLLGLSIRNLVLNSDVSNDLSTWDKKIEMLKASNELYRMIYGENLMFHHCRLSFNYHVISTYQIAQGKIDDTLDSLEKMCEHAIAYDKAYCCDRGKKYTSIFTNKIEYPEPSEDFHELKEHSECYRMLEKLKNTAYDSIRDSERFADVVKSLEEYSR